MMVIEIRSGPRPKMNPTKAPSPSKLDELHEAVKKMRPGDHIIVPGSEGWTVRTRVVKMGAVKKRAAKFAGIDDLHFGLLAQGQGGPAGALVIFRAADVDAAPATAASRPNAAPTFASNHPSYTGQPRPRATRL